MAENLAVSIYYQSRKRKAIPEKKRLLEDPMPNVS